MAIKFTPGFYTICSYRFITGLFLLLALSLTSVKTKAQTSTLPRPDHIVILIEENEPNSWIIGSSSILGDPQTYAPNINALAADSMSAVFTGMIAQTHPSQPNYLYLFSGDNQGVTTDDPPTNYPFTTPNMARELLDAGLSFATYSEDLPYTGAQDTTSALGSYARKHNPVANWQGTGTNQVPDSLSLPYTSLPTDYSMLPTVSYIVPDEDSDMHNGEGLPPIESGDTWFCEHLECHSQQSFFNWVRTHNTLFILTYDEDNGLYGNNIPTIFFGPMVKPGTYSQSVSLLSVLNMIETMYNMPYATSAVISAPPIDFCWKEEATGINTIHAASGLTIYPNPSSSVVNFDGHGLSDPNSELSVCDVTGLSLGKFAFPASGKLSIGTSQYATGVYFYHLIQDGVSVETGKFVVTH